MIALGPPRTPAFALPLGIVTCVLAAVTGWPGQRGFGQPPAVFEGPVPRAACGPGSCPEPALHPRFATNLTSPAMIDAWESLKVHQGRALLGGVLGSGPAPYGGYFDVYDVSGDCARPRLLASVPVNTLGHEGEWSPDGRTYNGTGFSAPGNVTAIDVSDPEAPRRIVTFVAPTLVHGLGVGPFTDGVQPPFAPEGAHR